MAKTIEVQHVSIKPNGKTDLAYFHATLKDESSKNILKKELVEKFTKAELIFIFGRKFYIVKVLWNEKDKFIEFIKELKKQKKSVKIKSPQHIICFSLSILPPSSKSFRTEFAKNFSSEALSIKDVAEIPAKKEGDFENFLKDFNHQPKEKK